MSAKLNAEPQLDWKFFNLRHGFFKLALIGSFLCLILPVVLWMYRNYYFINPFVPRDSGLTGSKLYGRNMEGDLQSIVILFLIENSVVLAVLLPYSFSRFYWVRLLILQFLYGFWFLLSTATAMHSSSLYVINIVGVLGINLLIFLWLLAAFVADRQNREVLNNQWNKLPRNN